jgi:hypothetical protein
MESVPEGATLQVGKHLIQRTGVGRPNVCPIEARRRFRQVTDGQGSFLRGRGEHRGCGLDAHRKLSQRLAREHAQALGVRWAQSKQNEVVRRKSPCTCFFTLGEENAIPFEAYLGEEV